MAVKFSNGFDVDPLTKEVKGDLVAETKADLEGDLIAKLKLPEGSTLAWGITCMTSNFEVGMLKSDGTWNWG